MCLFHAHVETICRSYVARFTCGLKQYERNFVLNTRGTREDIHTVPKRKKKSKVYYKESYKAFHEVHTLDVPIDKAMNLYAIQNTTTGDIFQDMHKGILDHNPLTDPTEVHANQDVPFP